jgi:hypothetical protein
VNTAIAAHIRLLYPFCVTTFATLFEPCDHANFAAREFASTRWIVTLRKLIVT